MRKKEDVLITARCECVVDEIGCPLVEEIVMPCEKAAVSRRLCVRERHDEHVSAFYKKGAVKISNKFPNCECLPSTGINSSFPSLCPFARG